MANRNNPLYWSFGLGSWFGVSLRISWLMPMLLVWVLYEFKFPLGVAIFVGLFVSVLLHEIGHVLAARAMDGSGDEILIWPLGGLAYVNSNSSPWAQFVTAIGGPFVNLLLCGLFLPAVFASNEPAKALNPLTLPISVNSFGHSNRTGDTTSSPAGDHLPPGSDTSTLLLDTQVLLFSLNWMMLLINLVPVFPFDGGQILRSWLSSRLGSSLSTEVSIRCAYVAGGILAVLGMFVFKHVILLALAFLILLLAMQESFQLQAGESYDDSFMGYDFSQGYTSLERANRGKEESRPGLLTRWRESRRLEKQRRLERQQQEVEQKLDDVLAKVHQHGLQALSPSERRLLKRASDRFRSKGQDQG